MPIGPVAAAALLCLLLGGWGGAWAASARLSRRLQMAILALALICTHVTWRSFSVAAAWLPLLTAAGLWLMTPFGGKLRSAVGIATGGVVGALAAYALPPGSPGALNIYYLDAHYALVGIALVLALVVSRTMQEQAAIALAVPVVALALVPYVPALPWAPVRAVVRMVGSDGGSGLIGPDWWVNAPLLAIAAVALVGAATGLYQKSRSRSVIFRRIGY